jgi:hypothetical protein
VGPFVNVPTQRPVRDMAGPTLVRYAHAHILDLMNQAVEAAELPLANQQPAIRRMSEKVIGPKGRLDFVTSQVKPGIVKLAVTYGRAVGSMRCAFLALALERYRRDHGRWPDTLDALVPSYLPRVPRSPQDGEPVRCHRQPDGIILYWEKRADKLDRRNRLAPWCDFQLWDMQYRRQPARELLPQPAEEEVRPSRETSDR